MIAQILNRNFVLGELVKVQSVLSQPKNKRRGSQVNLTAADAEIVKLLAAAVDREKIASIGQHGLKVERRGQVVPPTIEETAFISSDPIIGLLQSALEQNLKKRPNSAFVPDDNRRGVSALAGSGARRLLEKFSETDPGWVASLVAQGIQKFRKPHAFKYEPAGPIKIANNARIIILGDWGTGLPRAQAIANLIQQKIDEGKRAGIEQHVVHLGDVYYSGWDWEYRNRFLSFWPVSLEDASKISSWSLNGNHDMFSGGYGYFDTLLADPRFKRWHNGSSYFSLSNDNWQILGLDSAYDDNSFHGDQTNWIKRMTLASQRKTMLLSHHQLFSVYEKSSLAVDKAMQSVLDQNLIRAWLWGHEHRCVLYDSSCGVDFPRCIGHGGVPVYMLHGKNDPYVKPVRFEYREFSNPNSDVEHWAYFGFATLDFDGPKINATYVYENGFTHSEVIS